MNVYVETNFLLELVFEQEQAGSCEEIIELCASQKLQMVVPAYSIVEPYEKLVRQTNSRKALQENLDVELRQLARSTSYQQRFGSVQDVYELLTQSSEQERERFARYRSLFLEKAEIVPLTSQILVAATLCEQHFDLRPQDAVVYATTLGHLQQQQPPAACFLNRNTKDFNKPEIKKELANHHCSLIYRFDQGLQFIRSQLR